MGEYFTPIFLTEDNQVVSWLSSYDYDTGAKMMEQCWVEWNSFVRAVSTELMIPRKLVWCGDYGDEENWLEFCENNNKIKPPVPDDMARFIINEDKKLFVDRKVSIDTYGPNALEPLPLLTSTPQSGGGRYRGRGPVGSWIENHIRVSFYPPGPTYQEFQALFSHES